MLQSQESTSAQLSGAVPPLPSPASDMLQHLLTEVLPAASCEKLFGHEKACRASLQPEASLPAAETPRML